MKKNLLSILILIGLIVYSGYEYYRNRSIEPGQALQTDGSHLKTGIQKGELAPDFTLTDLKGALVHLSDFKGKKVLINFWATWCPPCRVELPHMQKYYQDFKSKDVVILGVNLTPTEENLISVGTFVDNQQLTYPIVLDKEGTVIQTYAVISYPTTYLLDSNGIIKEKFQGAINYDTMKVAVSKVN